MIMISGVPAGVFKDMPDAAWQINMLEYFIQVKEKEIESNVAELLNMKKRKEDLKKIIGN